MVAAGHACTCVVHTSIHMLTDARPYSGFKFAEMEMSKPRSHIHIMLCIQLTYMNNRFRASTDDANFTHPFRVTEYIRRKWERQGNLLEDQWPSGPRRPTSGRGRRDRTGSS